MPFEQEIDDDAKQVANQSRRGHDDAGYEHTFADIIPCDELCFNDTLTQSLDNQHRTIAQSYWLIEIAQQNYWHAHFEFQFMICNTAELQSV